MNTVRKLPLVDAIREGLHQEMARDSRVILLGSGVRVSTDGATAGMLEEFGPERVMDAPVAEAAYAGIATGAAMAGLRPVVRVGNLGFALSLLDQLLNQAAKAHYVYNGQVRVPAVFLFETAYEGWGVHHSQAIYALFGHLPGLYLVSPSTPADAKGLLVQAIRNDNPVAFTVHKDLYSVEDPVPEGEYLVEFGRATVARAGEDLTIVTSGWFTQRALQAAERLAGSDISVEVLDLRSLAPLDWETIVSSVRKTRRAVVYDQGYLSCGFAGTIAAGLQRRLFEELRAPILTLTTADTPVPYNLGLEAEVVPGVDQLVDTVHDCLAYCCAREVTT